MKCEIYANAAWLVCTLSSCSFFFRQPESQARMELASELHATAFLIRLHEQVALVTLAHCTSLEHAPEWQVKGHLWPHFN